MAKKTYVVVDVESDGGIIGDHSMVCFGAVVLDRQLQTTFYGQTKPISQLYDPQALAISGFSREEKNSKSVKLINNITNEIYDSFHDCTLKTKLSFTYIKNHLEKNKNLFSYATNKN